MFKLLILVAVFAVGFYTGTGRIPWSDLGKLKDLSKALSGETSQKPGPPAAPSLEDYIEPGRSTVFILSEAWCPACKTLEKHLKRFSAVRPDVSVKYLKADSYWRKKYNIKSIPHVVIFDEDATLVAADNGPDKSAYNYLYRWMNQELGRLGALTPAATSESLVTRD